jgi:hypothetical protein
MIIIVDAVEIVLGKWRFFLDFRTILGTQPALRSIMTLGAVALTLFDNLEGKSREAITLASQESVGFV